MDHKQKRSYANAKRDPILQFNGFIWVGWVIRVSFKDAFDFLNSFLVLFGFP
jgi:hypothetical protein